MGRGVRLRRWDNPSGQALNCPDSTKSDPGEDVGAEGAPHRVVAELGGDVPGDGGLDVAERSRPALHDGADHRIALDEPDGRLRGRRALSGLLDGRVRHAREAGLVEEPPHRRRVVEAERHLVELRRVGREERRDRVVPDPGDGVALDPVPHAHEVRPARGEHPVRLAHARRLVREEHEPELAHHDVEGAVREGEARAVRLAPLERGVGGDLAPRVGDHRVVEVGGDERPLAGEAPEEAPGDDPGAAGDLEHAHTREDRQPCGQIVRVGVEEEGPEVPVVVAGDVADERRVLLGHRPPTASPRRR